MTAAPPRTGHSGLLDNRIHIAASAVEAMVRPATSVATSVLRIIRDVLHGWGGRGSGGSLRGKGAVRAAQVPAPDLTTGVFRQEDNGYWLRHGNAKPALGDGHGDRRRSDCLAPGRLRRWWW